MVYFTLLFYTIYMNKELNKKLQIIQQNFDILERSFKIKKVGIFGSFSQGKQTKNSDIDILVEFSEPVGFFAFMELEHFLGKLLACKVDLATKKALKPIIKKNVLKQLVYA